MDINILFLIVTVVFIVGAIGGWKQGLIEGVIGLISCILGLCVLAAAAAGIESFMQKSYVRVGIALVVLAIISIAYKVVKIILDAFKLLRAIPIGKFADKLAGIALGLAEALFVVWIAFFIMDNITVMNINGWVFNQIAGNNILTSLYNANIIDTIVLNVTSNIHMTL